MIITKKEDANFILLINLQSSTLIFRVHSPKFQTQKTKNKKKREKNPLKQTTSNLENI